MANSDPTSTSASPPTQFTKKELTGICHCGRTIYTLPSAPTWINECNCTLCVRYGVLWAYFPKGSVELSFPFDDPASTDTYVYTRRDGNLALHFCPSCHVLVCWINLYPDSPKASGNMGVNVRLMPRKVWQVSSGSQVKHRVVEGPEDL